MACFIPAGHSGPHSLAAHQVLLQKHAGYECQESATGEWMISFARCFDATMFCLKVRHTEIAEAAVCSERLSEAQIASNSTSASTSCCCAGPGVHPRSTLGLG